MSSPPKDNRFQLSMFKPYNEIQPELGDLIEIDRRLYSHWAVYIGGDNVVHIVGDDGEDLPDSELAWVRRTSLGSLGGDSYMRINNKDVRAKERSLAPKDPEEVVAKAISMIGEKVPCNFFTRNAEHYLTDWKYGYSWSCQASVAMSAIKSLNRHSVSAGHTSLVNTLNEVLNSPGVNTPSSPSLQRSPISRSSSLSASCQTEPTQVI